MSLDSSLDSLLWAAVGGKPSTRTTSPDRNAACNNSNNDELKFLFVGGKGGVGKTTSSSAIATLLATRCGKRTLLVSTDPAHSLSDAFRCEFTNEPRSPGVENLDVMEIDPTDTMRGELAKWASLADDLAGGVADGGVDDDGGGSSSSSSSDLADKVRSFQEWLSAVPGIDEATALGTAIRWIESGDYDVIVFDTAPTGHTLKLLQMPDVLQAGIEKLQSWQGKVWGYWEMLKGMAPGAAGVASKKRAEGRALVEAKLEEYRRGMQKVALMLQDRVRTRFVVVCIAEYLSVAETRRLLQELERNRVRASHVIVNQLVVEDALTAPQLEELEGLAEVGSLHLDKTLLSKTVHACRLTTARKAIQEKYLGELKSCPETQDCLDGICELPLLAEEVTGCEAIRRFANLMVRDPPSEVSGATGAVGNGAKPQPLYDEILSEEKGSSKRGADGEWIPRKGECVEIVGLAKSTHFNGCQGTVISELDTETGRFGIEVQYNGQCKKLALQQKNLSVLKTERKKQKIQGGSGASPAPAGGATATEENISKAKKVLDDPEIKQMIEENPRFKDAVEDVLNNPMNFMKYVMDPEMSPLISKAMGKLQG